MTDKNANKFKVLAQYDVELYHDDIEEVMKSGRFKKNYRTNEGFDKGIGFLWGRYKYNSGSSQRIENGRRSGRTDSVRIRDTERSISEQYIGSRRADNGKSITDNPEKRYSIDIDEDLMAILDEEYSDTEKEMGSGSIEGGWLDLPQSPEVIDKYLKEVVKVDDEHEEYEIADIDDNISPFPYASIQWSSVKELNELAIIFSKLDECQREAIQAYLVSGYITDDEAVVCFYCRISFSLFHIEM